MPRITEATRKWQRKVKDLETDLEMSRRSRTLHQDENMKLKAKLERFEERERQMAHADMMGREAMQQEVMFLRDLVRDLSIPADVVAAKGKNEVRFEESRTRLDAIRQKQYRAEEAHRMQVERFKHANCKSDVVSE